jgi:hypothetical protein
MGYLAEDDILGFDVTVDDVMPMELADGIADLAHDRCDFGLGH